MRKYLIAVLFSSLVAVLSALPASAQSVTVSGNFVALNPASNTTASSDLGAALQLTQTVSAGYNQISVPSLNRSYRLGVANFSKPLSSYVGKKLTSKLLFDASQVTVTFQVGAGKVNQSGANSFNRIAETAGFHVSFALNSKLSWTPFGVNYLHGGSQPSNAFFTTGFNFSFQPWLTNRSNRKSSTSKPSARNAAISSGTK